MKWLWITALLFLVTGVKSGPTRNDGDPAVEGKIDKIERTAKRSAAASEQFKFTLSKISVNDITKVLLEVIESGTKLEEFYATDITPTMTPTFEVDLTDYSGKSLTFLTDGKNETFDTLAFATVDITPFPHFPGNTATQNLFDPRDTDKNKILLRVDGSLGDMLLEAGEALIIGSINYFAFEDITSVDYFPCKHCDTVEVCDKELTHSDTTGTKIDDTTVSSAVLAYGSDGKATIKLTFPVTAAAATHEAILIPQPPPPPQSPEENVLCTDAEFTGATCIIKWSDPSSAVLQLIIIQKTTGQDPNPDTWVTSTFDIHDRELAVTQLGTDIIEGRWLMLEGEYPGDAAIKSIYRLRKTVIGTNPLGYEDIVVDCSHLALEPRLCFGYFPHTAAGTYTLTVAYQGTGTADEMHQIESSPVTIKPPEPELEILSRHTATHQNQQRADVQICFQHLTPTDGRSFSHYEMLIINEKGQWLKHSIMEEEEEEEEEASEERLCFAPFSINTNDFDLTEGTKVIISQRGADGITVLASGESLLF